MGRHIIQTLLMLCRCLWDVQNGGTLDLIKYHYSYRHIFVYFVSMSSGQAPSTTGTPFPIDL